MPVITEAKRVNGVSKTKVEEPLKATLKDGSTARAGGRLVMPKVASLSGRGIDTKRVRESSDDCCSKSYFGLCD